MKIKFNSDDELLLNKTIEIPSMVKVVKALYQKSAIFVTFGISYTKGSSFNQMYAIDVIIYWIYFSQKQMHIEETLMKLNIYLFW